MVKKIGPSTEPWGMLKFKCVLLSISLLILIFKDRSLRLLIELIQCNSSNTKYIFESGEATFDRQLCQCCTKIQHQKDDIFHQSQDN